MTENLRPLIALDVDGVLNADAHSEAHHIVAPPADLPLSPFIRGGGREVLDVEVRLNPSHREWLQRLAQIGDLVWATTWENAANIHLAPLLGLPELPVAVSISTSPAKWNMDTASWKAGALTDYARDRPLVWIDDMAASYVQQWGETRTAPRLVLAPVETEGMQPWHLDAIEKFVSRLPSPTVEVADFSFATAAVLGDAFWLAREGVPSGRETRSGDAVLDLPLSAVPAVTDRMRQAIASADPGDDLLDEVRSDLTSIEALR